MAGTSDDWVRRAPPQMVPGVDAPVSPVPDGPVSTERLGDWPMVASYRPWSRSLLASTVCAVAAVRKSRVGTGEDVPLLWGQG